MKKFAQRLKELREFHAMTQSEIAAYLNLTSAAIGNYERGVREPGIEEMVLLADYFHVSLDYLVGRIDYPRKDRKKKIICYTVTNILKVPDSLNEKEIDMLIHIIANGKKYSWYEMR